MADVEVPFGDDPGETATLLLAAAEDLELPAGAVRTTGDGLFVVPAEVADKAGLNPENGKSKSAAKKTAAQK